MCRRCEFERVSVALCSTRSALASPESGRTGPEWQRQRITNHRSQKGRETTVPRRYPADILYDVVLPASPFSLDGRESDVYLSQTHAQTQTQCTFSALWLCLSRLSAHVSASGHSFSYRQNTLLVSRAALLDFASGVWTMSSGAVEPPARYRPIAVGGVARLSRVSSHVASN